MQVQTQFTKYSQHSVNDVKLKEVTPTSVAQQGPFDVLFLRLTEPAAKGDLETIEAFTAYLAENPEVIVKDPIQGQLVTIRRDAMAEIMEKLSSRKGKTGTIHAHLPELRLSVPKSSSILLSQFNTETDLLDFPFPARKVCVIF